MQDCGMMKLSMRNTDKKHQNERLKNTTQSDLGQKTSTPTIELLLNISKVINFIMF